MKRITQEEKDKIIILRQQGLSVVEISKQINRHNQFVTNCLKRENKFIKKETEYKRKYSVDINFFKEINTEEKAYIIGFICADGHIDRKTNRIRIQLATYDEDILEKIKIALKSSHPISRGIFENPYKNSNNKLCYKSLLNISSVELVKSLSFIPDNKTYSLNSSIINNIPKDLIRHFLRGYFDGDGNILYGIKYSSGYKYLIQIAGNKEFLENTFQKYFPSNNKLYYYKTSRQCHSWKLSSREQVSKFLEYLYKDSNIYLDRKFEIYKCAHTKPIELLETPPLKKMRAISSEAFKKERSETIEKQ